MSETNDLEVVDSPALDGGVVVEQADDQADPSEPLAGERLNDILKAIHAHLGETTQQQDEAGQARDRLSLSFLAMLIDNRDNQADLFATICSIVRREPAFLGPIYKAAVGALMSRVVEEEAVSGMTEMQES